MKKIRKQIILVVSIVFLVLGICSVAAVTGIPSDTGMNDVYVSPAGNDTSGDGTQANPYQTIGKGISEVNAGGTVHLADGIYQGAGNKDLTITKNVNIAGESQPGTVIDAQSAGRIFTVNSGVTVKIQDLTLENGRTFGHYWDTDGGAIYNSGTLNITNSTLTNNYALFGGAISNSGTLTVTGSTFMSNSAAAGGAIYNDGIRNNSGTMIVTGSTFTGNTADDYCGGAIASGDPQNMPFGTSIVTNSTFIGNTAGMGGAVFIWSNQSSSNIQFNRFIGNTASYRGNAIYIESNTSVNLQNNWWGSNTGPAGQIYGTNPDSWIVLTVTADPTTINTGETSQVTADLLHDNTGAYHDPANGHVPDGIPIQFQTNSGTITSSSTTSNGIATATFHAGNNTGPADVQATVDNQTVGTTVTVGSANQAPVANAGDDQTVNHNDLVTLNGSGSSDPDGDTLTYSWTLTAPAGSSATLSDPTSANPTFTPDLPGTYTAQLTVTDNKGAVSTQDTVEMNALNRNPIANIGGPYQDNEGFAITFNAGASNDPDGDTLTYQWDLNGDGIFESTGQTVSKTWGDNYTGTVTLKVTDPYGGINTTSTTVTVKNVAPTVTMGTVKQPDPFFILPTQNLTFNGSFTDPGWLDTHTATFDFGDGTTVPATVTEENNAPDSTGTVTANHAYTKPGNYTVTLTVIDKDGGSSTATTQVKVISATGADSILNNYIQGLPASAFTDSASQQKRTISNKINEINQRITSKDYNGALSRLSDLRDKADSSIGGNPKNDWIKDPTAQKDITKMIDDIIAYIKTL